MSRSNIHFFSGKNLLIFLLLLSLAALINKWVYLITLTVDEADYQASSPVLSSGLFLFALSISVLAWLVRGKIRTMHSGDSGAVRPRILLAVPVFLLTWFTLTIDYNFYLERWFFVDRLIILILAAAVLFADVVFLFAFISAFFIFIHQFDFPLGAYPLLEKRLLIQLLVLACAGAYLNLASLLTRKKFPDPAGLTLHYHWLILFTLISYYFYPAIEKIRISPSGTDWMLENEVVNNITAMMNRGWLEGAEHWQALIRSAAARFQVPLNLFVLLVECSVLLIPLHRKVSQVILLLLILMHLMIFAGNGGFFFGWIITCVLLILLIRKAMIAPQVFSWSSFFLVLVALPLAPLTIQPVMLGWFDSRVDNRFILTAGKPDGRHRLAVLSTAPFHNQMMSGNFLYVTPQPLHGPGFIVKDIYLNRLYKQVSSPGEVLVLLEKYGQVYYDQERMQRVRHWLTRYAAWHRDQKKITSSIRFIQPPLYWNAALTDPGSVTTIEPGDTIHLVHLISYMKQGMTVPLKDTTLMSVVVPFR